MSACLTSRSAMTASPDAPGTTQPNIAGTTTTSGAGPWSTTAGSTRSSARRVSRAACRGSRSYASARTFGAPGFDIEAVAAFDERDRGRLLGDAGIVRHRGKIEATIANVRAALEVRQSGESLAALIWQSEPVRTRPPKKFSEVPASTAELTALSKDPPGVGSASSDQQPCTRRCGPWASSTTIWPVVYPGLRPMPTLRYGGVRRGRQVVGVPGPQGAHGDRHDAGIGRPDAEPFDLRFIGRGGVAHDTAVLVLVANNRYVIDPRPRHGTRGDLDGGVLGIIAVTGPPPGGVSEWTTPTFRVGSATAVALGIDGESVAMEPPLLFESEPRKLRVLVSARRSLRGLPARPPRPAKRGSATPGDQP